jgi:hypothetical protein
MSQQPMISWANKKVTIPEMVELLFSPKRQQEAKAFFFIFSRRWNMPNKKKIKVMQPQI